MNCEQRVTIDYIPETAATIGVTADGITDVLDLKPAINNVESKTHLKLNKIEGSLDFWNENYIQTEEEGYLEQIPINEILNYGNLEQLANVDDTRPRAGDILYYTADVIGLCSE